MFQLTLDEWVDLVDRSKFATVTSGTAGNNIFSSDIPEEKTRYVWALILSNTAGTASTLDIKKVEEDDTTTDIAPNFNLAATETVTLSMEDMGMVLPALAGGTNLEFTASQASVEVTAFYTDHPEV